MSVKVGRRLGFMEGIGRDGIPAITEIMVRSRSRSRLGLALLKIMVRVRVRIL
jgi:hypothetical protein